MSQKKSIDYLQDNVYTVQSLLKKRGDDFLVEWYGFPKAEATWEKGQNIPKFILKVLNIFEFLKVDILYFSSIWMTQDALDKNFPTPRSSTAKILARVFYFITFHGRVLREESGLTVLFLPWNYLSLQKFQLFLPVTHAR